MKPDPALRADILDAARRLEQPAGCTVLRVGATLVPCEPFDWHAYRRHVLDELTRTAQDNVYNVD